MIGLAFVTVSLFVLALGKTAALRATGMFSLLLFGGFTVIVAAEMAFDGPPLGPFRDERVVIMPRRAKYLLLAAGCALCAAAGVVSFYGPDPQPGMAQMLIALSAIGFVALLVPVLNYPARVEIDRDGITDHRSVGVKIPWSDVRAIDYEGRRGGAHMRLWLCDPDKYRTQRRFNRPIDPVELHGMDYSSADSFIAVAILRLAPPHLLPAEEADEPEQWEDDEGE
jgi:hypothetical protein